MVSRVVFVARHLFAGRGALLCAAVLGLGGCAEILDIPEDPELEPTGPWRCVGESTEGLEAPSETATVSFYVCDFIQGCTRPVVGVTAKLCDKLDVNCIAPRSPIVTDVNGTLTFEVPTPQGRPFDGYVEVMPPLALCTDAAAFGPAARVICQLRPECNLDAPTPEACATPIYSPVLWFFNPPVVTSLPDPIALQLYPAAQLPPLIQAAGAQIDPTSASVFLTAWDCDGQPAPGVTLSVPDHDDVVQPLYYNTGVIRAGLDETDSSGIGGFIKVPPGFVNVAGENEDGTPVGIVGVQARLPFVTYTVLVPPSMQ
jgi:hypothetical protein